MINWEQLCAEVARVTGTSLQLLNATPVGGGCINSCYHLQTSQGNYFVKLNDARYLDMFKAEADGLRALHNSQTLRTPEPITWGTLQSRAYLVIEHIPLNGSRDETLAGRQLAHLHQNHGKSFGWPIDNFIGTTPQPNRQGNHWPDFWRHQRLEFQLELATRNGYRGNLQLLGEQLMSRLDRLIDHDPSPSLVHGDLWGGNMGYDSSGQPVIYDPAVYRGDPEVDLAMTELFGGFSNRFYAAYQEVQPLDPGYKVRKTLYNLYHILNHLNLFGGSYQRQAEGMMERLLSETRG